MRPCTDWFVTSTSPKRIWPPSGRTSPEIRFTSVVLPAPFEPISARTSLSLTVKFTWSTACVSPNHFMRSFVTSRLILAPSTSAPPLEACHEPARGPDDPGGQREHEPHQHADELGARLVVADRLERHPEGRVHDHPHQRDAEAERDEHVVVVRVGQERDLVPRPGHQPGEQRRRRHAEAIGAAGHPEELEGKRPEYLREGQGEDAEEDPR